MLGAVTADGEAVLPLQVLGEGGRHAAIEVVIDTGFTGELTLSPAAVRQLSLGFRGYREVTLANGSEDSLGLYEARVVWHGRRRSLEVLEADGGPLVGMALLRGSELHLRVVDGGEVVIEELFS